MGNKIKIITLGGNVETRPDYEKQVPGQSWAAQTLQRTFHAVHDQVEVNTVNICNKRDSRTLTETEKELMLAEIASGLEAGSTRIIVTTGVETISELAQSVGKRLQPACPVIFTGARWPQVHEGQSDALDNILKSATARLEPGVYVVLGKDVKEASSADFDFHRMMFVTPETVPADGAHITSP